MRPLTPILITLALSSTVGGRGAPAAELAPGRPAEPGASRSGPEVEAVSLDVQRSVRRILASRNRAAAARTTPVAQELRAVKGSLRRYLRAVASGDRAASLEDRRGALATALRGRPASPSTPPQAGEALRAVGSADERTERILRNYDRVVTEEDPSRRASLAKSLLYTLEFQGLRRQYRVDTERPMIVFPGDEASE